MVIAVGDDADSEPESISGDEVHVEVEIFFSPEIEDISFVWVHDASVEIDAKRTSGRRIDDFIKWVLKNTHKREYKNFIK